MVTVYKAKDLILNRYVAVKILRDEFTIDEEFAVTFFAGGCMNLIKALAKQDKAYDKEELKECFKKLVVDTLERITK